MCSDLLAVHGCSDLQVGGALGRADITGGLLPGEAAVQQHHHLQQHCSGNAGQVVPIMCPHTASFTSPLHRLSDFT
jgi:hypothetical protein